MSLIEVCSIIGTISLGIIAWALMDIAVRLRAFTSEAILYVPERQPPPPEVPPDKVESFYDAGVHPLVGHGKDACQFHVVDFQLILSRQGQAAAILPHLP